MNKKELIRQAIAETDNKHFHKIMNAYYDYIHDYLLLRNPNVTQEEIDTMCNLNCWYAELVDFIYAHEGIDK